MAPAQILTPAELRLTEASARGEIADFSSIDLSDNNPLDGGGWADERTISAEVLRPLLTRTNPAWTVRPVGLRVIGARITGTLDLAAAEVGFPIAFVKCCFERELLLQGASLASIFLGGSNLRGMNAQSLHASGDIQLCEGFSTCGALRFDHATIDGNFSCNGATLTSPDDGFVLFADEAAIRGHVLLSNGFRAMGEVSLRRAQIRGMLYCSHARFENSGRIALAADEVTVHGPTILSNSFVANGKVSMSRARLRRNLYCAHGVFKNPHGDALSLESAEIGGPAFLGEWFSAKGAVCLCDAKIAGDLYCVGGNFQNAGGNALCANGVSVGRNVRMDTRFLAQGAVRLANAKIGGTLNCAGGRFENPGGVALSAEGAEIARDAVLGSGFKALGSVYFAAAKIDGALETEGATYDEIITEGALIRGQ
jgi:hypothetical protein